jgi:hypothetical protein
MNFSPIVIGLVIAAILALTVLLSFLIARRQQDVLKLEHKTIPPKSVIFIAGLVTTLAYMGAITAAVLMLFAPFINLNLTGSVDDTTNLLIILFIVLALAGTGLYWLFVMLSLFSWKALTTDI